ncbi:MAG TPA: hypothetical protein VHX11_09340, partial [Acidobacteriaceae bacterium]|nr:hypothetical protein [Acidobacteriaceae bacterium]
YAFGPHRCRAALSFLELEIEGSCQFSVVGRQSPVVRASYEDSDGPQLRHLDRQQRSRNEETIA